MRKILMLIVLLLAAAECRAQVTYEVIKVDKDVNGNIQIFTQYKLDGVEVPSNYPPINGKYYWVTRFNATNFADVGSKEEMVSKIKNDLDEFGKTLVTNKFMVKENAKLLTDNTDLFMGITGAVDSATIKVSDTKEWVIENNEKTIVNINP